ncbi:MAG: hypothetical protein HON53_24860, partial [Planctomycetaceae bacterium]|nr:hypothetical protein [Planctomycetaceae bacterium]
LDHFAETLHRIVEEDSEFLHLAPHEAPVSRPDEVTAARKPVVKWMSQK